MQLLQTIGEMTPNEVYWAMTFEQFKECLIVLAIVLIIYFVHCISE